MVPTACLRLAGTYFKMLSRTGKENFRFVHVSTDEVFGDLKDDAKQLFHEEFPYKPSSHTPHQKPLQIILLGLGIEHLNFQL